MKKYFCVIIILICNFKLLNAQFINSIGIVNNFNVLNFSKNENKFEKCLQVKMGLTKNINLQFGILYNKEITYEDGIDWDYGLKYYKYINHFIGLQIAPNFILYTNKKIQLSTSIGFNEYFYLYNKKEIVEIKSKKVLYEYKIPEDEEFKVNSLFNITFAYQLSKRISLNIIPFVDYYLLSSNKDPASNNKIENLKGYIGLGINYHFKP